jgi:RecB family exonuclease
MDFGRPPGQASESDPTAEASLAGGCPAVEIELGTGKTVKFSGTIDRVDRARDGTIVVSDYKTGRQSDLANLLQDPVDRGRRLQLPLYAKAAADRFGQDSPVRARYWLLSSQRSAPCYELPLTEVVEERFTEAVRVIVDAIGSGLFPVPAPASTKRGPSSLVQIVSLACWSAESGLLMVPPLGR